MRKTVILNAVLSGAVLLALPALAAFPKEAAFLAENDAAMKTMMAGMMVKPSGDIDADFAAMMIPHHQGAIDMAAVELKYGSDAAILQLAREIKAAQQPEIDRMRAWQSAHGAVATADAAVERTAYGAASLTMMNGMMGDSMAHSGNADVDFVKLMIPHHQGAIAMAAVELKYGRDAGLHALAEAIIAAQQGEIAEMAAWLKVAAR